MEACIDVQPGAEAAFRASGCTTMPDFISSMADVESIAFDYDSDRRMSTLSVRRKAGDLSFWQFELEVLRAREDTGSFLSFLRSLPPICSNWCFNGAEFASADELSALFLGFTSPRCTLRSLELERIIISSASDRSSTKHIIRDSLLAANISTLESLFIQMPDLCSQEDLVPFLTRSASSLRQLTIDICGETLDEVHQILAALAHNTISPSYLSVRSYGTRQSRPSSVESENELGTMLRTNTSIDHLHLGCLIISGQVVEMIFTSLEENEHLTALSFYSCSGDGWPSSAFILDCLRSNGILSYLNLKKSTIAYMRSDPAIRAQLERNGENAKQVKELKAQQMNKRVAPTSIRLFLCGLPYSGKTTLSESLIKWNSTSSSIMSNCFPCTKSRVLERTRGIQLTALERDGVRMSLWDLAGESEYHAFHDFMFPNFSNEAIPSMFLFVWNPIKVNDATGQEIIHPVHGPSTKGREVFEHEFKYWLKFIASKSLNSIKFKPILFVAITRADLLHFDAKNLVKKNFNQYQEEFKAHVEFDMEGVFSMDARDSESVHDLATHMLKVAKQVLGRASLTYQASNLLRSVLADTKSTAPLMKKEQLFLLCKKNLGIDAKHIQESMALSLNDSGDIIYFNSCDLVVIDTQWFCHDIMGELIFYSINNTHLKGHFQRQVLEDLLESKVGSTRSKSPKCIRHVFTKPSKPWKIEGETLVNLLIALRLAFQENESSDVFIPACLSHESRGQIRPSSYFTGAAKEKMSTCIGRRLKCQDSVCTFFTPGIFSFLQMSLERIFSSGKVHVTLEGNVIALAYEGFQVFIEACGKQGEGHFIDVLIRSPEDLDFTLQWLHDTILDKVENICANPKGIQGVKLAYEVIQPVHVKDDYASEERTHTVSVEELKHILEKHLEKNGNFKKVRYSWPQTGDWEFVHALLGIQETLHVAESHIHSLSAAAEDALDMSMERRKDGESLQAIESEALEGAICSNVDQQPGCSSMPMDPVFKSTPSGKGMETMYLEVQNIRKKVDTLSNTANTINKKVDTINNKIDILNKKMDNIDNEIKSLRNEVVERLHKLLTFVEEGEAGKLPRMYVVTRGDGRLMHKMAAAVVPGLRSMRLGLLCEFKSKPHAVNGQPGLSLATLDNGLFRDVLPYVNAFLKVAQLAVKVGAHVAAGVGGSIPDFTHVLALIGDSDTVPDCPTNISETMDEPSTSSVPRVKYQEGQQWLYRVLSKHHCLTAIRIQKVFGLNRYRCRKSGVVTWLCDEHKSEGDHSPM